MREARRAQRSERRRGVIAMSAGNHAQAVAYHARRLAIPATIVMPVTTPFVKVEGDRGARRRPSSSTGRRLREAQTRAEAIAAERNLVWVHPYDDPHIIAGQGTIALEMLEEVPDLDVLVDPDRRRRPHCRLRHRRARSAAVNRDRRRRMCALSVDVERLHGAACHAAAQRWPKVSP